MFDVAPTELLLVAIVALLVIGPKDLPKAMRFVGHWVSRARGVARQFRSGFDSMVREAELAEMEKKWADENARIMREHPAGASSMPSAALPAPDDDIIPHHQARDPVFGTTGTGTEDAPLPVMVEAPVVAPADDMVAATAAEDGVQDVAGKRLESNDAELKDKAPS